jgi:site-specific DNA recombinase
MPKPQTSRTRGRAATRRRRSSPAPVPTTRQAVLYARVSTKDQEREGYSIPAQKELLETYARTHHYDIVQEFVDVETAKRAGRTSFTEMVRFLKRTRSCKVVLVEKTDRLYRNLKDWVHLDGMDLEIHLVKEGVVLSDDSRSTEKFMHGIRVLMAKNYIDNLSEEVKKGMTQKAREGHWPNMAPLGYINQRVNGKSTIVPDPAKADIIRGIFERVDAGMSLADATRWAKDAGLRGKRGGVIQGSTVHWLVRNPIYAGEFWWKDELYESKDPPLITMELFERVQARLDAHHDTRASTHDFAFAGLVRCAHCGKAVTAEIQKGKYIYYHCSTNCQKEKFVREERLIELFGQAIRELQLGPELLALAKQELLGSREAIKQDAEARMAVQRQRYDRFSTLIDKAYVDKLEGRIDEAFFQSKRQEWEAERSAAMEIMRRLARADHDNLDLAIQVLELSDQAYDLYSQRSPHDQRLLLDLLCSNSEMGGGKLKVQLRKPFCYLRNFAEEARNEKAPSTEIEGAPPIWWAILDLNQ